MADRYQDWVLVTTQSGQIFAGPEVLATEDLILIRPTVLLKEPIQIHIQQTQQGFQLMATPAMFPCLRMLVAWSSLIHWKELKADFRTALESQLTNLRASQSGIHLA